ncbi:polysaccharide deacetylase family protein [Luteimonas sp. A478]
MAIASLMYHDIVANGDWDASGFAGPSAASYKFSHDAFEHQLQALARTGLRFPRVSDLGSDARDACLITFDDGGASAVDAARRLDRHGMAGHFLITGARVGTPGFVTTADLRALIGGGHVVGSHSHTHPADISRLAADALAAEWRDSVALLSDLTGQPVEVASVPGGFHSTRVARAAAEAGIRYLFTSEPTITVGRVADSLVLGRYALQRGVGPAQVADLATGRSGARARQWLMWNLKKPAKRFAGPVYRSLRRRAFSGA